MNFFTSTVILAAVTLLLLWLMWRSWRRRGERDAALAPDTSTLVGAELGTFDRVFYVATTPIDTPLERIAIPGLSFRGWASVRVYTDGIEVGVTGEPLVTIPVGLIQGTTDRQLTIDKVVEKDGLTVLEWESSRGALATAFRFSSPEQQQQFALSIHDMLDRNTHASTTPFTKETP